MTNSNNYSMLFQHTNSNY